MPQKLKQTLAIVLLGAAVVFGGALAPSWNSHAQTQQVADPGHGGSGDGG